MTIFCTSDEHYDHENIIKYCNRPFKDVHHMREELIRRHNEVVTDSDIVYHLGDFCFNPIKTLDAVLPRLSGRHILIRGNHDKKIKNPVYSKFESVQSFMVLQDVLLRHYPHINGDNLDTSVAFIFHGHVHASWKMNGNRINVGVDVWDFYPVDFSTLYTLVKSNVGVYDPSVELGRKS